PVSLVLEGATLAGALWAAAVLRRVSIPPHCSHETLRRIAFLPGLRHPPRVPRPGPAGPGDGGLAAAGLPGSRRTVRAARISVPGRGRALGLAGAGLPAAAQARRLRMFAPPRRPPQRLHAPARAAA